MLFEEMLENVREGRRTLMKIVAWVVMVAAGLIAVVV